MSNDSLGDRMKGYEQASRTVLPGRMPVIIRVDGKAFHTYTRGTERPFDTKLADVMVDTAKKLCEEIQGAQLAYTQSDEISVLVHCYKKLNSSPWFDNQVQKMVSVAAGVASAYFTAQSHRIWGPVVEDLEGRSIKPAVFDARVFVIPEADVCNYFLWRQQDATRNSVQMLARSLYSHRQCENKNTFELKAMCAEKGTPWESIEPRFQRGCCVQRARTNERNPWYVVKNIPLFNEDREYVNNLLKVEEE